MSKSDFIYECFKALLVLAACAAAIFLGVRAQEPDNINPQDPSVATVADALPVLPGDRVWGEVPYCPNDDTLGYKSTDLKLWTDGCTLRWNKARMCFECL